MPTSTSSHLDSGPSSLFDGWRLGKPCAEKLARPKRANCVAGAQFYNAQKLRL
jgi:hypothetical protein